MSSMTDTRDEPVILRFSDPRPWPDAEPVARIPRRTMMAALASGLELELFWSGGELRARYSEPARPLPR